MRERRAPWPTVVTLSSLLILLGLGTWQVERLQWKEALNAARSARLAAPPVPLPAAPAEPEAYDFRRVTLEGRFLHEAELYLVAPSRRGEAGYHVVTPFERADGLGIVLVARGWVPYELKAPESRAEGQVSAVVTLDGIARQGGAQGPFVPDNEPAKGLWYWRDLRGMAAHLGLDAAPLLVEAGPAPNPGGYPVGAQTRVELRNDHLAYALTWYALAAVLAVVYLLYLRRGRGRTPP